MSLALAIITGLLAFLMISFGAMLVNDAAEKMYKEKVNATMIYFTGLVANFFDTLGIGSFAPLTAFLKYTKALDERILPGTLNVANAIPIMIQAIIYINVIEVDILTLVLLISASVVGSYISAGVIAKLPKKKIKIIMGVALIGVAGLMFARNIGYIDSLGTGSAIALEGTSLFIGIAVFFVLGILMSAGVGLYAPAMATVYLLGMSPAVAFPIMMGSCAFLMPFNSQKFIKAGAYSAKISIFITFGGVLGVVLAANIVKSLDLWILTYLVIAVVIITGVIMFYEGLTLKEKVEENSI